MHIHGCRQQKAGPEAGPYSQALTFTHLWPRGTAEVSAGSRARAEDLGDFLTLSEGPKGAQRALTEGLSGKDSTAEDR